MALVISFTNANADEHLWRKWRYESPQGSVTYTFEPGGQGFLNGVDRSKNSSTQKEIVFQFFYVIDISVVASSSIDSFREYIVKLWFPAVSFPSGDSTGIMRVLFRKDGKIEISEKDGSNKLVLTRIADLQI